MGRAEEHGGWSESDGKPSANSWVSRGSLLSVVEKGSSGIAGTGVHGAAPGWESPPVLAVHPLSEPYLEVMKGLLSGLWRTAEVAVSQQPVAGVRVTQVLT
jgi:hypothetical protein